MYNTHSYVSTLDSVSKNFLRHCIIQRDIPAAFTNVGTLVAIVQNSGYHPMFLYLLD